MDLQASFLTGVPERERWGPAGTAQEARFWVREVSCNSQGEAMGCSQ
jgi:hypothetical protein